MNVSTILRMRWRNCTRGDTSWPRLSPSHPATRNGRKTSLGSTARLPASKGRRKNFQGNSLGKSGLDTASLGRVFMDPWGINQWRWIFADDFRLDRSSTFAPKRGGDKSGFLGAVIFAAALFAPIIESSPERRELLGFRLLREPRGGPQGWSLTSILRGG